MWILPNNHPLSSAFAPEYVDWKEGLKEHCNDQSQLPLLLKSKPLLLPTLLRAWKRVYWLPHLSGRILRLSHGNSFTERYTESLEGIHVSRFQLPANRGGADDPRHLWPFIKTGINAVRPVFCFFENVRGHLNLGYEEVRRDLQELGYTVREGIYSAEEVGAPHRRDRLFILAIRNDQLENANSEPVWDNIGRVYGEITPAGSEVAHARLFGSQIRQEQAAGFKQSGESMEDSTSVRRGRRHNAGKDWERPFQAQRSGNMADSNGIGLRAEGDRTGNTGQLSEENAWPARPGSEQHEWEEKRVIESGLGCTINGYSFREDLLRALGNGVVEQTAELAFRDLLTKF